MPGKSRKMLAKITVLAVALLLISIPLVQGCGEGTTETTAATTPASTTETSSTASTTETSSTASTTETSSTTVPAQSPALDELLARVFGSTSVDPFYREVLSYAAEPYTDAEKDLAIKCYTEGSADTGHGSLTVALANGYTDNSWMNEVVMNFILQAIRQPEVKNIIITRAGGDNTKAVSDLRALIVEKPDIIVSLHTMGGGILPVFREALEAGITVIEFNGNSGGVVGADLSGVVALDWASTGTQMANIIVEDLGGQGNVAMVLGPTGFVPETMGVEAMMKVFSAHPGISVLPAINTLWTQESCFTGMSSLLARYPEIDAIYQSFGDSQRGVIRAYEQADRPYDVVAVHHNCDNGFFKHLIDVGDAGFKEYVSTGGNWGSRVALYMGILMESGASEPNNVTIPFVLVPADLSLYDPSLPETFNPLGVVPGEVVKAMYEE